MLLQLFQVEADVAGQFSDMRKNSWYRVGIYGVEFFLTTDLPLESVQIALREVSQMLD